MVEIYGKTALEEERTRAERARRMRGRKKRKRQIWRNRVLFGLACAVLLGLVGFGAYRLWRWRAAVPAAAGDSNSVATGAAAGLGLNLSDWRLILINDDSPLPEGYAVATKVADTATSRELQTEAADAFAAMKQAASADGVDLMLCSGYRSSEYQTELFQQEEQRWLNQGYSEADAFNQAKSVVSMPGCSEHTSGLAADIVTGAYQVMNAGFADTPAFAWLGEHAAEYGFILRYPEGKQAQTGIIYEPWHYRYVGAENATAIQKSGLCLEEIYAAG